MPDSAETFDRHRIANLERLLRHAQEEKVDALAHLLARVSREELDLLKERHPSLTDFVLEHYTVVRGYQPPAR